MDNYSEAELIDIDVLARTLWGEARGEGYKGMLAVGHVVLNRLFDHRWPNTFAEVCKQPRQFSVWDDPNMKKRMLDLTFQHMRNSGVWAVASEVALLTGRSDDPTYGANHYLTTALMWDEAKSPSWAAPRAITAVIGGHTFLKL